MGFKESLINDLDSIFFNNDEFTEQVTINDSQEKINVMIDNDALDKYKIVRDIETTGIYTAKLYLYVKVSDLDGKPAVHSIMKVNNKKYTVVGVLEDNGIYKIVLGVNRS